VRHSHSRYSVEYLHRPTTLSHKHFNMLRVQRCPAGHVPSSRSPTVAKTTAADPPIHGTIVMDHGNEDANTAFTDQFIDNPTQPFINRTKPQLLGPVETMESYSLEAKPTRVTLAETFSSGEDGDYGYEDDHCYHADHHQHHHRQQQHEEVEQYVMGVRHTFSSDDEYQHGVPNLGNSFINLAEEAADVHHHGSASYEHDNDDNGRDDYLSNRLGTDSTYSSGEDFINLAQEASKIPSRHFRTTTALREDEFESYAQLYGLEEEGDEEHLQERTWHEQDDMVLQFVDSEDGQAFSFRTRANHDRLVSTVTYENNSSRHYCTVDEDALQHNVSLEATSFGYETCSRTLNTNLETLHTGLEGVNYIPTHNDHEVVHDPAYHNIIHHGSIELHGPTRDDAEGESYDDDEERIGGAVGVHIAPNSSYMYEEDGYVRSTHSDREDGLLQNNTFQETVTTYHDDAITEFTRDTNTLEARDGEYTEVLSQLMDSYLSDRSSTTSWDEGSYVSASRTVSRLDSFDGTEYTEDTNRGNGTLMDILKNFRGMNVRDHRGMSYSDDEDGEAETMSDIEEERGDAKRKRRTKQRRSRRRSTGSKIDLTSVLGQIGTVGMNLLNETMDQSQQRSRKSSRGRRRSSDQAGKIIDSLRDIFSCGAPSRY
jgi:hypothetical protein